MPRNNAILVEWLDVKKIFVDFSDVQNIYDAIGAKRISTIHTQKTQDISKSLGIHLVGYVNREFDTLNNDVACRLSGYDFLGSKMLICKTDDKFNNLPFSEEELEKVYAYITGEEDSLEEVMDYDDDDDEIIDTYVLDFKVDVRWPVFLPDQTHRNYHYVFPFAYYIEGERLPFPDFGSLIEVEGFDRLNDAVELILHMGKEDKRVKVFLDKEVEIPFDYCSSEKQDSHRIGVMRLKLLKRFLTDEEIDGKLHLSFETFTNGESTEKVEKDIEELVNYEDDEEDRVFDLMGSYFYNVAFIDEPSGYIILMMSPIDSKDYYYIPVSYNEPNIETMEWTEKRLRIKNKQSIVSISLLKE